MGRKFAANMMWTGTAGRADTYDVYSLGRHSDAPKLLSTGPLPRMCCTVTDLGDSGVLLAGGRGSPANALSDCWLFHKGAGCRWQSTWSLPVVLFRHGAVRLAGSSLALVMGGKTAASRMSDDCFVFDPERGWLRCRVAGARPRPTFGAVVCCSSQSTSNADGIFHGLLAGGMGQDGRIVGEKHSWRLDMTEPKPAIRFEAITGSQRNGDALSLFGAKCVDMGGCTMACGGMGQDASFQGRHVVAVTVREDGSYTAQPLSGREGNGAVRMPLMIGSSVVPLEQGVVLVMGGGATCFSMGTFWETGVYSLAVGNDGFWKAGSSGPSPRRQAAGMGHVESRKFVGGTSIDGGLAGTRGGKATVAAVPRIRLSADKQFDQVVGDGRPVIIQGLDLGDCLQKWMAEYMVERVGAETKVVVHECRRETEKMDFNTKNFDYVSHPFGRAMAKLQAGGRLYLRSLSRDRPSEQPANMERDFLRLA